jgi:hypothetical protein
MTGTPRLCPGCRSLDGIHDYGETCTLRESVLELSEYWIVIWEPRWRTKKGVGQVGCVFATEAEARAMLAAWPDGQVVKVERSCR